MDASLVKALDENLNLRGFMFMSQEAQITSLGMYIKDRPDVTSMLSVVHSLNKAAIEVGTEVNNMGRDVNSRGGSRV